jgi:outer membrane protein
VQNNFINNQQTKTKMKTTIKTIVAAVAMVCLSVTKSSAQKIAHIDFDSLISIMPEMDSVRKVSQEFVKTLEAQLIKMQTELQNKYQDYQANKDKMTDLIKQIKEKELQDLQANIQDFQQNAQGEIQKKNEELGEPINQKARNAIKKVAMAKGYKYVLDTSMDNVLYSEPADDILALVKLELKIK